MSKNLTAIAIVVALNGCQAEPDRPVTEQIDTVVNQQPEASSQESKPLDTHSEVVELSSGSAIEAIEPEPILPATDVWERIRRQMQMEVPDNEQIAHFRNWYIENPRHLITVAERAKPFMHMIVEEIEKRELPIELALLPIVESAFDVFAYSPSSAVGVWQFTAPTGGAFGLEQNWWYDGRRDVHAATIAAMDMMQYLHKKLHKNWLYALAAYNTGEGRVFRSIRRNKEEGKPTDFFSLKLPSETERYVPQLLALADVVKHADQYGVTLPKIDNQPAVQLVDAGAQIDLTMAAELAGLSLPELHKLNPGYNRWATPPTGPHTLLLPLENAERFSAQLAQSDTVRLMKWDRYTVQGGDSLGLIARKYKTQISVLQSANKLSGHTIYKGQTLMVPAVSKAQGFELLADQKITPKPLQPNGKKIQHVVRSGDTLWSIARKNNVSIAELSKWNNVSAKDTLRLGHKLSIWKDQNTKSDSNVATISDMTRKVHYTVRSGDSLSKIGQRFKVSVSDLVRWNQLNGRNYLRPGQTLTVHVNVARS